MIPLLLSCLAVAVLTLLFLKGATMKENSRE
jgi:hypothetical protein